MGVTLIGGGPVARGALEAALRLAPLIVAADGGADRALRLGHMPAAVVGDFDSITARARASIPPGRLHPVTEQDTTDFDKALRAVEAPFVLGMGFSGARLDHGLAVLNTLARHPARRCLILGARDVSFLAPQGQALRFDLPRGTRVSLFPLAEVRGRSDGLRWPIDGIRFAPDALIGTSNEATGGPVRLWIDSGPMLVILPRAHLERALRGLLPGVGGP